MTRRQEGGITIVAAVIVAGGVALATLLVVAGSWLALVARAQGVADAAALAAASAAHPDAETALGPREAALRIVEAAGASLRECQCRAGRTSAEVVVVLRVGAGVAPAWLVGDHVVASARAVAWSEPVAVATLKPG